MKCLTHVTATEQEGQFIGYKALNTGTVARDIKVQCRVAGCGKL